MPFSPTNLRSAIYNLLSNAVKYRDPNRPSRVRMYAYSVGPRAVLEVPDNDLGLDFTQSQAQLVGMFQRLPTHVEDLGTCLCRGKKMVSNARGTTNMQSELGNGSTFTVYISLSPS